jgi:putative membrane protein
MLPDVAVDPAGALAALAAVAVGVALGTCSGLVPGLHANNFALLLAAVAPAVPGPPRLVGAAMLAAGVVHTFLDVVPALALGVPDAAMAATALPGHQLVVEGRGREALRLSALGSAIAVVAAVPLAVPVTAAMTDLYPVVRAHLPAVLTAVAALLLWTESSPRAAAAGLLALLASAGLGFALLDTPARGLLPTGSMLMPLFAGLFGAPVLVEAVGGSGVPPQADARVTMPKPALATAGLTGAAAGGVVGFLPGVSAAVAAVVALAALPVERGPRAFVVVTSGVNTANTVFALFALDALGTPRTGVLVALDRSGAPVALPLLLAAVALAACAGAVLVPVAGDRYLATVGRADYTRLSAGVLALLLGLSLAFAGPLGVGAFCVATVVGLVPPRLGARRVHLMGVLLGPLVVG